MCNNLTIFFQFGKFREWSQSGSKSEWYKCHFIFINEAYISREKYFLKIFNRSAGPYSNIQINNTGWEIAEKMG